VTVYPLYDFCVGPRSSGYFRDAESGNDYAVNRFMSPGFGRFITQDPSGDSWDPSNPGSWNSYAYALGDPINLTDPSGLDAVPTPPVVTSPTPDCGTGFINLATAEGETLADLFNTDVGVLAVMSFFEQEGSGTTADQNLWAALDWTFVNRWQLSYSAAVAFYGSATSIPATFQATVTQGSQVFSGGVLKVGFTDMLYNILAGSPGSSACNGLDYAFAVANGVALGADGLPGGIADPVPGALQFSSSSTGVSGSAPGGAGAPVGTIADGSYTWTFYAPKKPVKKVPVNRPRNKQTQ
jgi:RHS repeat-associated protein